VDLSPWTALPLRALLFGEAQGRIIVSSEVPEQVVAVAARHGVPARVIGTVRPASWGLALTVGARVIRAQVPARSRAYHDAIPDAMQRSAATAGKSSLALGAPV
jgi:phosphoribosylformylglycinamidine synthase